FFSDPFQVHHERMRQMMRGFSDPFGQGFMPSITDGRHRGNRGAGPPNTSPNRRSDRPGRSGQRVTATERHKDQLATLAAQNAKLSPRVHL
ncbi:Myeloid leukemia factor 1, partial [Anabarilius grahami]